MSSTQRTTVYLEPELHRALRLKAAEDHTSLSVLINQAVRHELATDLEDARALDERRGEPSRPFEDFLAELADDGVL